jgi:drug/metabolite transporter (DMT)-like permease
MTYASLLPLVVGAAMTTVGDGEMKFTDAGFLLTIFGVVLAAIKVCYPGFHWRSFVTDSQQTVVTNRFMTGSLALPPVEFLMRMSPLAALQALACATVTGEVTGFMKHMASEEVSLIPTALTLGSNGFLAFLLNIASFNTNKLAGALTMTVCGNLKQIMTVALGIVIFNVHIDFLNGLGMLVTLAGAGLFSKAELDNKKKKATAAYKPVNQNPQ